MQVRFSKLLVSSIIFGVFIVFVVLTFYQSYGSLWTIDFEGKMESELDLKVTDKQEKPLKFKMPVRGERNIIFLETTCVVSSAGYKIEDSELILNGERACAIESAAITNPNASIYLFYTCPLEMESLVRSDRVVSRVFDYPNVYVWHQSMETIFMASPLEELYSSGKILMSMYPNTHGSDVLRYLMLWNFGGIYLDLDFVVKRSFDPLGPNFVGAESWEYLNSAALGLASDGLGAEIAQESIEELSTNFRGNDWGYNGPGLITRIMRKRCNAKTTQEMTLHACGGFNVLEAPVFYPVYYQQWRLFYNESTSTSTMSKLTQATAVHLWNSMKVLDLNKTPVELRRGSLQPIALLHQEFCPNVNQLVIEEAKMALGSVV